MIHLFDYESKIRSFIWPIVQYPPLSSIPPLIYKKVRHAHAIHLARGYASFETQLERG